jgi:predicted nucleic acid-binding protein
MKRVLIDSDVILDFFFDRTPFAKDATILLSHCEAGRIRGYITPVIASNTYYLLSKTASHKKVTEKLIQLLTFIDVLTMDKSVVERAINSGFTDFEDALQNYAAMQHGKIDAIVTRNVKDYKRSEISILTPELFLKVLTT